MTPEDAYHLGLEEGIRAYAWMKDGVYYVGTTGRTLQAALIHAKAGTYPTPLAVITNTQQLDTTQDDPHPQDPVRLVALAGLAVGDSFPTIAAAASESLVNEDSTVWDEVVEEVHETWGADYVWRQLLVLVPSGPLVAALSSVEVEGTVEW